MSVPITHCLLFKAAVDETAYVNLLSRMRYNLAKGHFSEWPCEHDPRCEPPSQELMDKLHERLEKDLKNVKRK